jgi:hypothetical protein
VAYSVGNLALLGRRRVATHKPLLLVFERSAATPATNSMRNWGPTPIFHPYCSADGERDFQQQRAQQVFGWNGRLAGVRIAGVEQPAHVAEDGIHQRAQAAQRVVGRYARVQADIVNIGTCGDSWPRMDRGRKLRRGNQAIV